jgi:hypothetical protein
MLDQTSGVEARERRAESERQIRHDGGVKEDCHVEAWVLQTSAGTGKSETRDMVKDEDGTVGNSEIKIRIGEREVKFMDENGGP